MNDILRWNKRSRSVNGKKLNDNDNDEPEKKKQCFPCNGITDNLSITVTRNHIYFYAGVTKKSCLALNIELKKLATKIMSDNYNFRNKDQYIYLHINSYGGSIFAALSTIDTITNLPIPVVSIIEGAAASAATLISVVCSHRIILANSFMLIHQLSSSCWGKMSEIEDEVKNLKVLTNKIVEIYEKYTNLEEDELDKILKHDIWWDAQKCLTSGLVDKITNSKQLYKINLKKIILD